MKGAETYVHYFQDWAHNPAAYYANHGEVADAAEYLKTVPSDVPILFSTEYPNHPTILYLAPQVFPRVLWFNGQQSILFPPAGQRYLYVYSVNYQPRWTDLSTYFQPSQLVHEGHDPSGAVSYRVYQSDAPPPQAKPLQPLSANFGGLAQFQGTALPGSIPAGQTIPLQEYWNVIKTAPPGIRAFAHLVDGQGHLWAQADNLGAYSEGWRPGDIAINEQPLEVPATAPPVPMKVQFGFYMPNSGQRLPLLDAAGTSTGNELTLGTVQVQPATSPPLRPIPNAMSKQVAPGLTLIGYQLNADTVQAGGSLPVTLFWRVDAAVGAIPPLQLTGADTNDFGLADSLSPADWPRGLPLEDRHDVQVGPTSRAGQTSVQIGGVTIGQVSVTEPRRISRSRTCSISSDFRLVILPSWPGYSVTLQHPEARFTWICCGRPGPAPPPATRSLSTSWTETTKSLPSEMTSPSRVPCQPPTG